MTVEDLRRQQYEVQHSVNWLLHCIINTNNISTIQSVIDHIHTTSNCLFGPCSFLYQHLYTISQSSDLIVTDEIYDLALLDVAIQTSNEIHLSIQTLKTQQ